MLTASTARWARGRRNKNTLPPVVNGHKMVMAGRECRGNSGECAEHPLNMAVGKSKRSAASAATDAMPREARRQHEACRHSLAIIRREPTERAVIVAPQSLSETHQPGRGSDVLFAIMET